MFKEIAIDNHKFNYEEEYYEIPFILTRFFLLFFY